MNGSRTQAELVHIQIEGQALDGILGVPDNAWGVVVFAHGLGSSRFSSRNQFVAQELRRKGLATLLFDLHTAVEREANGFAHTLSPNVDLLADRVTAATDWLLAQPFVAELSIGYFGSSTGAAAALVACTRRPKLIEAVVTRSGRPDLAVPVLPDVQAPTLLIVGSRDVPILQMNEEAQQHFSVETALEVIPGATHLFGEPGALEKAARLAHNWFRQYLS